MTEKELNSYRFSPYHLLTRSLPAPFADFHYGKEEKRTK